MKTFLIQFDRRLSRLVLFEEYEEGDRKKAVERRFRLELEAAHSGADHEIVLLEAADRALLRRTHTRYFNSFEELLDEFAATSGNGEDPA